ncbi:hypothetical protein [Nocardia nepalensis]|uniref:hypothetical protein n=1 Tax=Nocardia nepalensis TaxID=3375448 RepID=UPI003B670A91
MTARMYGYLQLSLVGTGKALAEQQIEAFAASRGGVVDRCFYELAPRVGVLWSLLEAVDRRSSEPVAPALAEVAHRQGISLDRLLDSPPSTAAFWAAVAELDRVGGGYIITLSPEHLDGLGAPRSILLDRISRTHPSIEILYATAITEPARPDERLASNRREVVSSSSGVVGEFHVAALGCAVEVASLTVHMDLSRAGLVDMVDHVDALLREIIGSAVAFDAQTVPETTNQLSIRLVRDHQRLRVLVHETREHAREPISHTVEALCGLTGRAVRTRSASGGTITCCELPLEDYGGPVERVRSDLPGEDPHDHAPALRGRSLPGSSVGRRS